MMKMQNKPIWKILAILIALLTFVSSAALSIAVDDSTNNTSDRLDELPFYNAAIHVQHSQQSDHEIHIGYQPSTHQIAAILAAEKGWWEEDLNKFGIEKVTMKEFPSGSPEMTAMLAGDLDVAYVGVAPPIAAMYEGLDAKIVAGVQTQGSALVLRPELVDEYEGPASLKGKTIATFPPGSIQHTVLSKWLLDNGIDPEGEVTLKAMGPSEATAAISAKAVDTVFLPSPSPTIIEVAGNGVIVEWSGSIWPNHACCCVVASGEMIREHPEIVKQIIKTHIRATEYEIAHPNEAAEIFAQWHGADVSTIKRSINISDMQWIHDPHLEVESGIKYAAVIYDLNRERYKVRGVEVFEEEDIFDTSFYDEIRSVSPDVNAKSSIEWHTSDQDAMQIAMSQNKPAMILFSSARCPACAMLADELVDTRVINMSTNFVPVVRA
jgi:NitT/TauT family transport system substrate-binding protein